MEKYNNELYIACYEVAKGIMFEMRPINVTEIENLAKSYYEVAEEFVTLVNEFGQDSNLITRAVEYIANTHANPSTRRDNILFREHLTVLIELAFPNVIQTTKSAQFIEDILNGIRLSK